MCGIIGYIGSDYVTSILLKGLEILEYRGYDSAGIALDVNDEFKVIKETGKLVNLVNKIGDINYDSHRGIGHIRWATHGTPTIENAHPHTSMDNKIVLVHNGIIENYIKIKEELMNEGVIFQSSTDTEVAVHLISKFYQKTNNLEAAIRLAMDKIEGAYAFCVMCVDEPDKIIAIRNNAPLIIGIGDNGNYIASDMPAIIGGAKKMICLANQEFAIITKDDVVIKNFMGIKINKHAEDILIKEDVISKRGYNHFMLKEIMEQPEIVRKFLQVYLRDNDNKTFNNFNLNNLFNDIEKIEIIACGTSLHAGLVGKTLIEQLCKIPVEVISASEYIYKINLTDEKTLCIGISQSGETADTINALVQARKAGAKNLVITNRENSSIIRVADEVLYLNAGIEISVAATKSYVAQLFVLYFIGLNLAQYKNKLTVDYIVQLKQELLELPAKMEEILSMREQIKDVAIKYKDYKNFIYIARGINLATSLEGALKLKEISYINANSYVAGELKHGPIALIDENMPVLSILLPNSVTYQKVISNAMETKARKAKLIAMTTKQADFSNDIFDDTIKIPNVMEILSPLLFAIPMQLFAYYIANGLNLDVDKPRNLAKSVTVE